MLPMSPLKAAKWIAIAFPQEIKEASQLEPLPRRQKALALFNSSFLSINLRVARRLQSFPSPQPKLLILQNLP